MEQNKKIVVYIIVAILVAGLVWWGGSMLTKKTYEEGELDIEQSELNDTQEAGSANLGAGLENRAGLPETFPSDVFVARGMVTVIDDKTIVIASTEPIEDLFALYDEQLTAEGWEISFFGSAFEGGSINASKDGRNISVTIADEGDVRSIVIQTDVLAM